jgi:hypothetical protein
MFDVLEKNEKAAEHEVYNLLKLIFFVNYINRS